MMDFDDSSRGMSRVNIHDKRHIITKSIQNAKIHQNKTKDVMDASSSHQYMTKDQRLQPPKSMSLPTQTKHVILPLKTQNPHSQTQNTKLEHKRQKEGEITFINVTRVRFLSSLGSFLLF